MATDDERGATDGGALVRFPLSRTTPAGSPGGFVDLGTGAMARRLGMRTAGTTGRWCSRCRGIWFGYALEVECPRCGNRHG
ncbi:hypothetical protein RUR49_19705 [Pseudoxanthobacter sp. M-2]|uniref:hypothetical protein n=1 Tax=Pseudoxanthobacter sp. M-2 TaxID=3078754 RepID=UPI0038FBEF4C